MTTMPDRIGLLAGRLIVSCQAPSGSPLRDPVIIAKIAQAAVLGGAAGLRVNSAEDITAVRAVTDVPIIGLHKVGGPRRYIITPDLEAATGLVGAGADMIAIDATEEVWGTDFSLITTVRDTLGVPVMADVSTLDEGLRGWDAGALAVGTTLSGYTPESPAADRPDLDLVSALAGRGITVVAEGRYRTPEQVTQAFEAGAYAVVVGGAITDPMTTTALFAAATPGGKA